MHTAPYFTAFGLLTILHAWRVMRLRLKHKVAFGTGDVPELHLMVRVHGNHSEYVPMGLLLLLALEFIQAPVWYMHLTGTIFLVGRVLHAIGLPMPLQRGKLPLVRMAGMTLTLIGLALGAVGATLFTMLAPA